MLKLILSLVASSALSHISLFSSRYFSTVWCDCSDSNLMNNKEIIISTIIHIHIIASLMAQMVKR